MIFRFVVFAIVVFTIVGSLGVYLDRRLQRSFGLGPRGRRALRSVLVVAALLAFGGRALTSIPVAILEPAQSAGFVVMLAAVIAALLLVAIDLVVRVAALLRRRIPMPAQRAAAAPPPLIAPPVVAPPLADASLAAPPDTEPAVADASLAAPPATELAVADASLAAPALPIAAPRADLPGLSRRTFLGQATAGSAVLVGVSSSVYGNLIGRHDYVIQDVPMRIPGLSRSLDGYTIVQLSDLHIGTFVRDAELRAAEDLVQRARPDLVILTGDLIDHDRRYADVLARFVRRLGALPRHGVFAIPGNHDYYTGLDAVRGAVVGAGATMLINDGRVIGESGRGFALLGVDDPFGPRSDPRAAGPDLSRAIAAVTPDLPRVLLCHNPQLFPTSVGRVALQLSGHTHGGQITLGTGPARLALGHPFIAGDYRLGDTSLHVNRGFGTAGPPARIGAPPEVSRIILTV